MNLLLVGLVLLATATSGVALGDASIGGEDDEADSPQSVYLVFGADAASENLDQWVDEFKSGDSSQVANSTVVQYQDVDQLNVNQQDQAVAISINGGQANAIQQNDQANDNRQIAVAEANNTFVETTTLSNVEQVNVIFAGGENASGGFSGMVVEDGSDGDDEAQNSQYAEAQVIQSQDVDQLNFNNQSAAIAIAANNSTAAAYQVSDQENRNTQYAEADAVNVNEGGGSTEQEADSSVEQQQDVTQANVNLQGLAVAIAANNSTATAVQRSEQYNANAQVASAEATNVQVGSVFGMSGVSMAAAVPSGSEAGTANDSDNESGNGSGAETADAPDDSSGTVAMHNSGGTSMTTQESVAKIKQHQDVTQRNINEQNLALAIAVNNSSAQALQSSTQINVNVQAAEVDSANLHSRTTSLIISGAEASDRPGWAIEFDGSGESTDQRAWTHIEQTQLIDQLNFNHQSAAVAVAIDEGESNAFQTSQQYNENIQEGLANATNIAVSDGSGGAAQPTDDGSSSAEGTSEDGSSDKKDKSDDSSSDKKSKSDDGSSDTKSASDDGSSGDESTSDDGSSDDGTSTSDDGSSDDGASTSDDGSGENGDSSLPGFGVGVAALSLLGAALFALRRE